MFRLLMLRGVAQMQMRLTSSPIVRRHGSMGCFGRTLAQSKGEGAVGFGEADLLVAPGPRKCVAGLSGKGCKQESRRNLQGCSQIVYSPRILLAAAWISLILSSLPPASA